MAETNSLSVANVRIAVLAVRMIWLSLLIAALTAIPEVLDTFNRPLRWTAAFAGAIVLCSGFQIANAHRQLARIAPPRARPWMPAVSYFMYLVGSLLLGSGMLVGVRLLTAP